MILMKMSLLSSYDGIISGQSNDVDFMSGVFQSFSDAPGGFSEELKEFTQGTFQVSMYMMTLLLLRAGYFNESEEKGARKFILLEQDLNFQEPELIYLNLFSASKIPSPLETTLRFS